MTLAVEGHIAVHHGADAYCSQVLNLNVILIAYIGTQIGIAVLQTVPDGLIAVCPQTLYKLVLPGMTTLGYRSLVLINQHSLDTCAAEFDSQDGAAGFYSSTCVHITSGLC